MGDSNLFGAKAPRLQHLVRGSGGLAGEINDLRGDIDEAFVALENGGGFLFTEEFTNPAAADTDAIKLAVVVPAASGPIQFSGAQLDGAIGVLEMDPPRNFSLLTGGTTADISAGNCIVVGTVRDKDGNLIAQTDTLAIAANQAGATLGTKAFAFITTIDLDTAQDGALGEYEFGFGDVIGLSKAIKTRAGLTAPIREVAAGAVVTTGTFVDAATDAPHGTYAPATVPDAANDYALTYEVDPAV